MTTDTQPAHTPLPWFKIEDNSVDFTAIAIVPKIEGRLDINNEVLGSSEWLRVKPQDLEFIVKAANSHYELLEALRGMFQLCQDYGRGQLERNADVIKAAQAAIAKAEGR